MPKAAQSRTPIWLAIARSLKEDFAERKYRPGDRLPTEAELSRRFGVNRHTVRHALSHLIDEGLVQSRRGSGSYVKTHPADYPIGSRVRFHQNLLAAGRTPEKKVLTIDVRPSSRSEAENLKISEGDPICAYCGISLVDGLPVGLFQSHFPEWKLAGIADILASETSVTRALAELGVTDYTRESTRLSARAADATQALHLEIAENAPLLYAAGINVDVDGTPIEYGRTFFVGERITLTLSKDALG